MEIIFVDTSIKLYIVQESNEAKAAMQQNGMWQIRKLGNLFLQLHDFSSYIVHVLLSNYLIKFYDNGAIEWQMFPTVVVKLSYNIIDANHNI